VFFIPQQVHPFSAIKRAITAFHPTIARLAVHFSAKKKTLILTAFFSFSQHTLLHSKSAFDTLHKTRFRF
jgi:hypothetical protein